MAMYQRSIARSSLDPPLRVLIELLSRIAFEEMIAQNSKTVSDQLDQKAA